MYKNSLFIIFHCDSKLRMLAMHEANTPSNSNFWVFWSIIIYHLLNYRPECLEIADCAVFAYFIASILNSHLINLRLVIKLSQLLAIPSCFYLARNNNVWASTFGASG